jgi:hypothetical protein
MGKKKDGKDKLPKTIAGVKVPKELRKGGQFARFMQDPLVREIALAALAAGLAARKDARRAAKKAALEVGDAAEDVGRGAGWVKAAVGAAAVEAGRMVIEAIEDSGSRSKAASANGKGRDKSDKAAEPAEADAGGARH